MVKFGGACIFLAATAGGALAQEQASFNSLAGSGYEIRSVLLVPVEAVKRVDSTSPDIDAVAITLQNGTSVAVCYIGLSNWVNLVPKSLDNAELCARH